MLFTYTFAVSYTAPFHTKSSGHMVTGEQADTQIGPTNCHVRQ